MPKAATEKPPDTTVPVWQQMHRQPFSAAYLSYAEPVKQQARAQSQKLRHLEERKRRFDLSIEEFGIARVTSLYVSKSMIFLLQGAAGLLNVSSGIIKRFSFIRPILLYGA